MINPSDMPEGLPLVLWFMPYRWAFPAMLYLEFDNKEFSGATPCEVNGIARGAAAGLAVNQTAGFLAPALDPNICPDMGYICEDARACFGDDGRAVLKTLHHDFETIRADPSVISANVLFVAASVLVLKVMFWFVLACVTRSRRQSDNGADDDAGFGRFRAQHDDADHAGTSGPRAAAVDDADADGGRPVDCKV